MFSRNVDVTTFSQVKKGFTQQKKNCLNKQKIARLRPELIYDQFEILVVMNMNAFLSPTTSYGSMRIKKTTI